MLDHLFKGEIDVLVEVCLAVKSTDNEGVLVFSSELYSDM